VTLRLKNISAAFLVVLLTGLGGEAMARCDIVDVIELVKDGETRTSIRHECNSIVNDARGCSLTKVMRYANDGLSERQIARRCKSSARPPATTRGLVVPRPKAVPQVQIARFCTTALGTCPMMVRIPSGSRCHCVMPYGPVFGVAR
jgi:hypothetical protein